MKNKYFAVYQCPMCNEKFRISDKITELDSNEIPKLFGRIIQSQSFINNPYLPTAPLQIPHECKNGSVGLAQFIGLQKY